MLKKLKNKKGFTLVELIVAMALSLIITVAAVSFFQPTNWVVQEIHANADMDVLCDTANKYIRNSTMTAYSARLASFDTYSIDKINTSHHLEQYISDLNEKNKSLPVGSEYKYYICVVGCINGKLYDSGKIDINLVDTLSNINSMLSSAYSGSTSKLAFNEPFYNGMEYKLTVEKTDTKWVSLTSQCFKDGNAVNMARKTGYKFIGSQSVINNENLNADDPNVVIIYSIYSK